MAKRLMITFKGRTSLVAESYDTDTREVYSSQDERALSQRNVLILTFPSEVNKDDLISAYTANDNTLSEIAIDDATINPDYISDEDTPNEKKYFHNIHVFAYYMIPVSLDLEMIDGRFKWVMVLAELTETDKALRDIAGKIAKKVDFLTLDEYRQSLIDKSNDDLARFLATHPLISACHQNIFRKYSATLQHQFLFTSNYLAYYTKKAAGIPAEFRWNETGKTCEPWTEAEALFFMNDMSDYVTPLVEAQQEYEMKIRACETKEELDQITIDYSTVKTDNISEYQVGTHGSYISVEVKSDENDENADQ